DGSRMYLVLNNLADESERLDVQMPRPQKLNIRRFGRNDDFTPYYIETQIDSAKQLTLAGRETIVLVAEYGKAIEAARSVNERPCYGNRVDVAIKDEEAFTINVPDAGNLDYASLRIGMSRPADADRGIQVKFNGNDIYIPVETCAERLADHDKRDYASCKIVSLPVELVEKENKVKVAFNDDKPGSVGSVVIRAAVKQ
ncbi:MAG: beta-agarase, partial [Anaerohalosphaeraceae bacterium]